MWIVDKTAWTETVTKYRNETKYKETWWINVNGNIAKYYSREDWMAARQYNRHNAIVSSWGNGEYEAYTVQVPYTETITHSEGNYEIKQRGVHWNRM